MSIKYWHMTKLVLVVSSISNRATHFGLLNSGKHQFSLRMGVVFMTLLLKLMHHIMILPSELLHTSDQSMELLFYQDHLQLKSVITCLTWTQKNTKEFEIYINVMPIKITLILKLALKRVIFFSIKCFVCVFFHTSMCIRISICIGQFPLIPRFQPFSMIVMEHFWT